MLKEVIVVGLGSWIISWVYRLDSLTKREQLKFLPVLLLAFWLLWQVKYYVAGVAFAGFGAAYLASGFTSQEKSTIAYFGVWLGLLGLATLTYPPIHPDLLLQTLYGNYVEIIAMSAENSVVIYPHWDGSLLGAIRSIPRVLFASLIAPLPGNTWNLWSMISSVENVAFLALFGLAGLYSIRFSKLLSIHTKPSYWALTALLFVLVMAVFIGLSTPNLGTLVRYRVTFLPIVLVWVFNVLTSKSR